jgi:outer membrane usher protein
MTQTLSSQVLADVGIAASRNRLAGSGLQATIGLEHRSLRHGFSLRVEKATPDFRQIGFQNGGLQPTLTAAAAYNYLHSTLGSFGVAFAKTVTAAAATIESYTLSYGTRVFDTGSLSLNLTRVIGNSSGTALNVTFSVPLGTRAMSVVASATARGGHVDAYGSLIAPLTQETGVGGRAVAGTRAGEAFSEGGVYYQGGKGFVSADLSVSRDTQSMRFGGQGGFAVAEGRFFAARRIDDSFAIVEVPGYSDIGIGFGGGSLTMTDAAGIAVLPRLRAYDVNSIQLDPRQLPISAELDSIEQVVVPAARSAVKVTFPVRTGRGALLKLVLDSGDFVPAGAEVELMGDGKEFFVARRGEAFVTGLQAKNQIRVKFNGQACTVAVELPPAEKDEISRIGPLRCAGVKP